MCHFFLDNFIILCQNHKMKSLSRLLNHQNEPELSDSHGDGKNIRISKFLCTRGVCSRRKAEELIGLNQIRLNGELVRSPVTFIDPQEDEVMVEGKIIPKDSPEKIYVLLNKPRCVVTSLDDPENRSTIKDYLKGISVRVFPVGRLDYLSEGLLLLTNDGDFAQKIMHPSFGVTKTYEVKVFGHVTPELLTKLKAGYKDESGNIVTPKKIRVLQVLPNKTWLEFQLEEGKNREIRNICAHSGITIDKLRRVSIGKLDCWNLASGKYMVLSKRQALSALEKPDEKTMNSPKESIRLKSFKNSSKFRPADGKEFFKFRKEHYQSTMKSREAQVN